MWKLMPFSEYRRLAVEDGQREGMNATARRLGLGKTTLYRWQRELVEAARAVAFENRKAPAPVPAVRDIQV
jgi:transposase-like protein